PPFSPNRVLAQLSFVRVGDHYEEAPLRTLVHHSVRQPSETNLHRRIQDFSRSACFIWYSAKTLANGKGSVMVYSVTGERVEIWYAVPNRSQGWGLSAMKGASRENVWRLFNTR